MSSLPERRPIIRGEQVFLRAAEREDLPLFVRWFNDIDVLHNLSMHAPMSHAGEAAWFDRMLAAQGSTDYHFVICLLADAREIGTIGLHGLDFQNGNAEFGIAIGEKSEWDKGHGTDALRAICDFGFGELRLERISLIVYSGNERAQRSYRKAGFTHEGTLRRSHFARGEYHDAHVMSLLRDEWSALPHRRSWEYD
ncbi:MAG: GNAT family N-acetyltransferase [Chloroflexota bacterium]